MEIYFRVVLFCVMDMLFNKSLSNIQKQSTAEENNNSIFSNENTSSVLNGENSSASAIPYSMLLTTSIYSTVENSTAVTETENSTLSLPSESPTFSTPGVSTYSATDYAYEICPIITSIFTFPDHASQFTVFTFSVMGFYLMNMLLLLTSWKKVTLIGTFFITSMPIIAIYCLSTYTQIFEFGIILEAHWIILVNASFFLIISCFMYLQLRGESQLPLVLLTIVTILAYFIVSFANFKSVEFHLIKFLLSAVLIHMSVLKTPMLNIILNETNQIKIFHYFCFVYTLPSMLFTEDFYLYVTKNEWRNVFNLVFDSNNMVVFRVFIAVFLLLCITHIIYFIFDLLLSIKRESMSITLHSVEKLFFSPVIFYAFFIDKGLSVLSIEHMWWFLKPYVIMHTLAILANFCNSIKQSMFDVDQDNIFTKIHRFILLLLICISSIILCTFFIDSPLSHFELDIFIFLTSYNVLFSLISMVLPFLKFYITRRSLTKIGKKMLWVSVLIYFELWLTVLLYSATCFIFLAQVISFCYYCGCAEVLVLFGGFYFAFNALRTLRKNLGPLRNFDNFYYNTSISDVGQQELKNMKDIDCCSICEIVMSSGCCVTFCRHYYHSNCLIKWMSTSNLCPQCKANLYGYPNTYSVVKKVAV